ncbi:Peptidase M20 domain-containing protein 2 [Pleurostoma richardsiae]|uniref:Peptidase M20 domain-containing protein 2 n=1 Tax=Pleurostoma richardsiae TaxID=41990 RepID=A0AA38R742_9PEZI|nr:Peptidase M20 domain-containing protein 2 [Pleurostoma richardsiae]
MVMLPIFGVSSSVDASVLRQELHAWMKEPHSFALCALLRGFYKIQRLSESEWNSPGFSLPCILVRTNNTMTAIPLLETSSDNPAYTVEGKPDNGLEKKAREIVASTVERLEQDLFALNRAIHLHPETCYEEIFAHATLTDFLETQGFHTQRHAYGLDTSFSAECGLGGRLVIFCAEYDALPGIGHGCGHNLIATASVAAFVSAATALMAAGVAGRVRILGTPAEEGGGGKVKLIQAGAFSEDVSAAIMCHALPLHQIKAGWSGTAGFRTMASRRFHVEFHGRNAHAGSQPWGGINALDAAVGAYSAVSMLRQHIRPFERIQGIIEDGGQVPNVIPDYSRMAWGLRSSSVREVDALYERVKSCMDGAATASGCTVQFTPMAPYMELRVNHTLCKEYISEMELMGEKILLQDDEPSCAGTDMGNVSHIVPGFHGIFGIPTPLGVPVHHRSFADAAATTQAHDATLRSAKAMAMLAFKVLTNLETAANINFDFVQGQNPELEVAVFDSFID